MFDILLLRVCLKFTRERYDRFRFFSKKTTPCVRCYGITVILLPATLK